jgi:hypothetical protein
MIKATQFAVGPRTGAEFSNASSFENPRDASAQRCQGATRATEQTVSSPASNRLSMLVMLQQLPGKVNDFNPIGFSECTGTDHNHRGPPRNRTTRPRHRILR